MSTTVLLTGLNGFVAVHVAVAFLSRGHHVVGTVRSEDKKAKVNELFALKKYAADGSLQVFVVPDLVNADWDWDTPLLKDVNAIAHVASPYDLTLPTYGQYAAPAIAGTRNLLQAASKNPNIKSVAVLSSMAASLDGFGKAPTDHGGKVYTEDDWLPFTEEDAEKSDNNPGLWYSVSKKYAELEAWKVQKDTNAKWTLATILPPAIFGPPDQIGDLKELQGSFGKDISTSTIFATLALGTTVELPGDFTVRYVDVRDTAEATYLAITTHANGRFHNDGEKYTSKRIVDIARKLRPDLDRFFNKAKEDRLDEPPAGSYDVDASKSVRELGLKYRTLEDTVQGTIDTFERLGLYANA
ncbi:hypothetical protein B9479_003239 [Cryptococcus floricola]|uniref:NAD-dependent epimerase/dehydratase domain-containing protein n=1 Tax=Cryptococcus floricola TaxID=2591691 RepID=A0A5D3AX57_9TREE|nr:hypothetical protein B9479_003239 [Cryptococcus floricola]